MKRSAMVIELQQLIKEHADTKVSRLEAHQILRDLEKLGMIFNRYDCYATGDVFEVSEMVPNGKVGFEPEEEA